MSDNKVDSDAPLTPDDLAIPADAPEYLIWSGAPAGHYGDRSGTLLRKDGSVVGSWVSSSDSWLRQDLFRHLTVSAEERAVLAREAPLYNVTLPVWLREANRRWAESQATDQVSRPADEGGEGRG